MRADFSTADFTTDLKKMCTFDFWKKILFSGWMAGAYIPQTSLKG